MVPLSLVLQKEPRRRDLLGVFVGTFFNLEARLHTVELKDRRGNYAVTFLGVDLFRDT